jgi:hypothetical protein
MADRYQDRSFSSDGFGRGGDPRAEADPLAELARLIGQSDPQPGRGAPQAAPRAQAGWPSAPAEIEPELSIPPGPPSWMQRANRQEIPRGQQQVPASARDPFAELSREPQRAAPGYAAPGYPAAQPGHDDQDYDDREQDFHNQQSQHGGIAPQFPDQHFADELAKLDFGVESRQRFTGDDAEPHAPREPAFEAQGADPSRYDEALYGELGPAQQDYQGEQDYQDDHLGYQDYDEADEEQAPKRRGGKAMVLAILALGFLGTGSAFAYRHYFSATRSGEPPIIKADNSPTKIMATPADSAPKVPDRLLGGDGSEKLVSREETPVDPTRSIGNSAAPRVIFPQLNQNTNPPPPSSVAPGALASAAPTVGDGTMPNADPRPIRTLSVNGNAAGNGAPALAPPAIKPARAIAAQPVPHNSPANANASANNAPMAITPQQAPANRVAALTPTEQPVARSASSGEYLVSVLSQDSEANALAAFKSMQGKYPSVLASRSPTIKQVEKDGKTWYRAAVGPFATFDEARQMCASYRSAGGQCFPFKN